MNAASLIDKAIAGTEARHVNPWGHGIKLGRRLLLITDTYDGEEPTGWTWATYTWGWGTHTDPSRGVGGWDLDARGSASRAELLDVYNMLAAFAHGMEVGDWWAGEKS